MNAEQFSQKLIDLNACSDARKWAEGKSFEEVYTTCHRGDWLCWLFKKTNPDDLQLLTLVKGHQVNTVRHLMKDEGSLKAVDTAIAFGERSATIEELDAAAAAAHAAYAAAYDKNRQQTADIFRQFISIEKFNL